MRLFGVSDHVLLAWPLTTLPQGRFAGMGADVGAPPGPVAVPNFAKKPAIIGVAIVIVLVVGFALLRSPGTESTSSTSGSGTEKKAVPDTACVGQ